jgi:hypothetical protein
MGAADAPRPPAALIAGLTEDERKILAGLLDKLFGDVRRTIPTDSG